MAKDTLRAVFLDTSFLITLTDANRADHAVARKYFAYWYESGVKMFVSAVCYAEYLAKADALAAFVLNAVEVVSFNAEAAALAGKIHRARLQVQTDGALKDDIKIIASACTTHAAAIAHCDGSSKSKFIARAGESFSEAKHLHMLRAFYPAMCSCAEKNLMAERSLEVNDMCMPIKQILNLISGTR